MVGESRRTYKSSSEGQISIHKSWLSVSESQTITRTPSKVITCDTTLFGLPTTSQFCRIISA
ncbi:MAG: hypothetical protein [Inoviridae sp.]|nr:MAG: hypothetical protein [Inoviridae sp.]